jgi:hypothetical protein
MLDLEEQLREYGGYLDELVAAAAVETELVAAPAARRSNRARLVAATVIVVALVGGTVAVAARRDGAHHLTTVGSGDSKHSTPTTGPAAITRAHPTFAQQVAQLEAWYAHAGADAPGGRPILNSEYEVCDYRGSALGSDVQGSFASYFPLTEPFGAAALVEGCTERDGVPQGGSSTSHLCTSVRRGPVYDSTAPHKAFAKPVVVFGSSDCATAGYGPFTPAFLDALDQRRHIEIEMWAVPRACPTQDEATQWVEKVSGQRLPSAWTVVGPPPMNAKAPTLTVPPGPSPPASAGSCVRPARIDWDLERVTLERF